MNQWTLLVGSLPIVFAISAGHLSGLPLDSLQREELFLTAAQSVFAIAVLANRSMSVREAWALFGLFISQFVLGGVLPDDLRELERLGVGIVYLVLAAWIFVQQRSYLRPLVRDGLVVPVDELFHEEATRRGKIVTVRTPIPRTPSRRRTARRVAGGAAAVRCSACACWSRRA